MRLEDRVEACIEDALKGMYEAFPELLERYGERGVQKCREDNRHHFRHLDTAYLLRSSNIFTDYALWLNGMLVRFGMKPDHLIDNFERLIRSIPKRFEEDRAASYVEYLHQAIAAMRQGLGNAVSPVSKD
ncbi:hypothetical protein [Paenibacillus turpanensis]|uniref:hypothetical protein n=1 Tax=Paenibacillus turpanensis TaxID=2689078 RepID=UPI00140CB83E|nr:hypothetical protein [Paenibacillus turpanensis]